MMQLLHWHWWLTNILNTNSLLMNPAYRQSFLGFRPKPLTDIWLTNKVRGVLCRPDQVTYMVWIELTVSGQTVQKSLDVWSEDGVKSCIIYFIQMFSKTVPEVKGNLHDLDQNKDQDRGRPGLLSDIKGNLHNLDHKDQKTETLVFLYLVLWVSCTDQQQLQCPQVSHTLTRSPNCRL